MKPKILFIETGMGFGGSIVSLHQIVKNLNSYSPVVCFYSDKEDYITNKFKNIKTYYFNLFINYKSTYILYKYINRYFPNNYVNAFLKKIFVCFSYLNDIYIYKKIIYIIKKEKISLLHSNNSINSIHLKVGKKCNIPIVVHLRGHVDTCCSDRSLNLLISKLIAPTNKIRSYAVEQLFVDNDKILHIPNSIDIDYFSNEVDLSVLLNNEIKKSSSTVVVGVFARIIQMKGQIFLIRALISLLKDGVDVFCVLVGNESDFNSDYIEKIKIDIRESGYTDKFYFAGYQDNVRLFYNFVDIVVHPSIEEEAFGRVIIEAWSEKKPVIASDIGASMELIRDGVDGLIYHKYDINSLSSAIRTLVLDKNKRAVIGENGYFRVKSEFDSVVVVKSIEKIYDSLLVDKSS